MAVHRRARGTASSGEQASRLRHDPSWKGFYLAGTNSAFVALSLFGVVGPSS